MFNYKETLQKMKRERASMQAEVAKLDQAIGALQRSWGIRFLLGLSRDFRRKERSGLQCKKVCEGQAQDFC